MNRPSLEVRVGFTLAMVSAATLAATAERKGVERQGGMHRPAIWRKL